MMMKIPERLQIEKAIMKQELPQFKLKKGKCGWYFEGWHTTTSLQRKFKLKVVLPKYYPDQMPMAYISYPITLTKMSGGTINDTAFSHAFHTEGTGPDGCIKICHSNPTIWNASMTCISVFVKSMLWVEAYDVHSFTGQDISVILDEWQNLQS